MTSTQKDVQVRDVVFKVVFLTDTMPHRGTERISQKELHLARQTSQSMDDGGDTIETSHKPHPHTYPIGRSDSSP